MIKKIKSYAASRYGIDTLGKFSIGAMLVFYLLVIITKQQLLSVFVYFFLLSFLMRSLSSNHYARQQENERFLRKINLIKMRFRDRKTYKYYECKCCSKILRVPKGKGKIEVRCPRCNNTLRKRT